MNNSNNPKTGTFYTVNGELVHESDFKQPNPDSKKKPAKPEQPEQAENAKE